MVAKYVYCITHSVSWKIYKKNQLIPLAAKRNPKKKEKISRERESKKPKCDK